MQIVCKLGEGQRKGANGEGIENDHRALLEKRFFA